MSVIRVVLHNNLIHFGSPASTAFRSASRPTAVALTEEGEAPPHCFSFRFEHNEEGFPLVAFPFVLNTTRRKKLLLVAFPSISNTARRVKPLLIVFPFVLNAAGRGKPLLIAFPFVLNATGRGKPLLFAFPFVWMRWGGVSPLVVFPFILTVSGREDTRENAKGLGV